MTGNEVGAAVPGWLARANVKQAIAPIPVTGEVVNLADPQEVGRVWDDLDEQIAQLVAFRKGLGQVMLAYMDSRARHTMTLGGVKVSGDRGDTETTYDVTVLPDLLACDPPLPQDRYDELVKTKIEYTVSKREADAIAASNPEWRKVIDRARQTRPKARSVRRGR
jgi:hypothetical protein